MKSAFEAYQKLQSAIQGGLSEVHSASLSPLTMVKRFVQGKAGQAQPESRELEELRERLAEMEASLKKKKRSPMRRPPAS